jgi:hypothetical protein
MSVNASAASKEAPTNWWGLAIEVVGALVVVYLFIAVMMTAMAQQRVTAALDVISKGQNAGKLVGYSAAWSYVQLGDRTRSDQERDRKALVDQLKVQTQATDGLQEAVGDLDRSWVSFAQVAERNDILNTCGITPPAKDDEDSHYRLWSAMTGCPAEGTLSSKQSQDVNRALAGVGNYATLYVIWQKAVRVSLDADAQVQQLTARIGQEDNSLKEQTAYLEAFSETSVLKSWFLGHGMFVPVPPSMIEILLSFLSGTFGALLITLVLVVYPQSALSIGETTAHASRIFLGGLVALCVFIVLSGGSAILGNAATFNASQANFMTFAAVGILAGMFSDRVALWLSARANAFFGAQAQQAKGGSPPQPPAPGNGG